MLSILVAVLYISAVAFAAGVVVERLLLPRSAPVDPLRTALLGLIGITTLLSGLSLIFQLCGWIHLGIVTAAFAGGLLLRPRFAERPRPRKLWWALLPALAVTLYLAAGPALVYDTGFYHAQAVRWLNEYGAVRGLANLHGRLAFNSSWFVWAALWDHGPLDGKGYHAVNAAFWLLGFGLCLQGIARLGKEARPSALLQAAMLLPLCRFQHYAASLSPELPAHVLLLYLLALTARILEEPEASRVLRPLVLTLAAFLLTVKLSMAPAVFCAVLVLGKAPGEGRPAWRWAGGLLLMGIVVLPFLARNVLLSGYLVYPFERLDLFPVDWKVPAEQVREMRLEVRGWAIEPWVGPTAALRPWSEWLGPWFTRSVSRHPLELVMLAAGFPLTLAALAVRKEQLRLLLLIPLIGVVYWFASAPDFRFGYGWIVAAVALPAALLLCRTGRSDLSRWRGVLTVFSILWVVVGGVRHGPGLSALSGLNLIPLPTVAMRQVWVESGLLVAVPATGDRAWNASLPNAPLANPRLRLRGPALRFGFTQQPP